MTKALSLHTKDDSPELRGKRQNVRNGESWNSKKKNDNKVLKQKLFMIFDVIE